VIAALSRAWRSTSSSASNAQPTVLTRMADPLPQRRAIRKGYLRATAPAAGPGHGKFRIARSELDRWIRGEPDTTEYLLQSPANAARLLEAVHDHRAGRNLQEQDLLPDAD
jgi:hypothetical protein